MPAKFHEIPSMGLQDIKETKRYGRTDAWTDGRENSIPPLKLRFGGGYNYKIHHALHYGLNFCKFKLVFYIISQQLCGDLHIS